MKRVLFHIGRPYRHADYPDVSLPDIPCPAESQASFTIDGEWKMVDAPIGALGILRYIGFTVPDEPAGRSLWGMLPASIAAALYHGYVSRTSRGEEVRVETPLPLLRSRATWLITALPDGSTLRVHVALGA